jgi:CubicO group peptidase (beta-lactamase class C family)
MERTSLTGQTARKFRRMLSRLFQILLVIALIPVGGGAASGASQAPLQQDLEKILAQEGLMGIAWVLLEEDGSVNPGAAGKRDALSGEDFTINTRFHVGSVTKSLLATGVLRLVATGAVDLDAPVSRYLQLPFVNPWADRSEVTVRHLLDHTAGLDDARFWQTFSERPTPDTPLESVFPEPEALLEVRSRPGSRFSYSNMGYTLLGMIIESATGERYEAYLDENLLTPLGMHDSTFSYTTQEGVDADPDLAWGHVDDGSRYAASPVFVRPAAQFTTTVGDMARFTRFLLSDGSLDEQVFIDLDLMRSRGIPQNTEAANNGLVAGYALGLGRRDRHGVVGLCHGGNIVGFVAMLCIYPEENKAFAYSVNTDSETANYGLLDAVLIDALSIEKVPQPQAVNSIPDTQQWHGWHVLSPNRFKMFEYLDTVFGAIRVSPDNGSLVMSGLQQKPRKLRPIGGYLFSVDDRTTTSHVFIRGDDGEFLISDGFKTYRKVPAAYLFAHWASMLAGLAGMIWLFVCGVFLSVRYRIGVFRQPVAPAFLGLLLTLLSMPLFLLQSFMALGDFTVASASLALATLLLPIGLIFTIIRSWKLQSITLPGRMHALAAVFALQWCMVLIVAGMMPFRLWA